MKTKARRLSLQIIRKCNKRFRYAGVPGVCPFDNHP